MKKILFGLILFSNLCFGWGYGKVFRYDLEKNIQVISQNEMQSEYINLYVFQVDDDVLCINLSGNYDIGSIFNVKIYVDDKKIDELSMLAINTKGIQYPLTEEIINAFKKGDTAILSFTHSDGASTYIFPLAGFTNAFNQINDISYYSF